MQIIYHVSYCEIRTPKIKEEKYTKDFGTGFYCTILEEQARKWAQKYSTEKSLKCIKYIGKQNCEEE